MSTSETRADSKWSRLAPLSGVIFMVLYLIGSLLIAAFDYLPGTSEVVDFFADDALRIQTGAYIATVSVFFLLWFSGSLKTFLSKAEGGDGRLATVAFGGGVASSSMVLVSSLIMLAAAARAGVDSGIRLEAATLSYDLYGSIVGSGLSISMASVIGATAVVILRSGALPRWLGWASVAIAVGLLTPINWALLALVLPWVAAVSIWIYLDGTRPQTDIV